MLLQAMIVATLLVIPRNSSAQELAGGFVMEQVFAGRSEGRGSLRLLAGKERAFRVESFGAMQSDGSFRLNQDVSFEGKPVQSRHWIMRQRDGQSSVSLSDAAGPVTVRTEGRRLLLRYRLNRGGLVMHQRLELAADEKSVSNRGTIRFLGIPVGRLRETIQLDR
jgi:hypothetical protein